MRVCSILLSALLLATLGAAVIITSNPSDVVNQTYTHIIVGGGTGGLAVASRLAEVISFKILVIEAGPDARFDPVVNNPEHVNPAISKYSWFYATTPQEVNGQTLIIPQGKVLGGSSSINDMQWTRGTLDQYDAFQRLGNPGWNSTSLFSYMKRSEHFNPPNPVQTALADTFEPSAHGSNGPINAGYPNPQRTAFTFNSYVQSVVNFFNNSISGLNARGPVQKIKDLCTGDPNGIARFFFSIIPSTDGTKRIPNKRASSAVGYIYPFVPSNASTCSSSNTDTTYKNNLIILTGHQAVKMLWKPRTSNTANALATGVAFIPTPITSVSVPLSTTVPTVAPVPTAQARYANRENTKFQVNLSSSRGEVIVSSGALGSPAFLERSGVGDPKILNHFSIPTIVNLPSVGTNLQDQPLTTSLYNLKKTPPSGVPVEQYDDITNIPSFGSVAFLNIFQILGKQQGTAMAQRLLNTANQRAVDIVNSGGHTSVSGLQKALTEQAQSMLNRNAPVVEVSFTVHYNDTPGVLGNLVWNLLPQVRGTVHIQSADPAILPAVDPRYLTTDFELLLHSNATKLSRLIFNTAPLSNIVASEIQPGATVTTDNDTEWQSFVKKNVAPVIHPIGSCTMSPKADGGVVDPSLTVYGTMNVRVVDSSVIPIQISAHLSSTVYGIAERAADIIKAEF